MERQNALASKHGSKGGDFTTGIFRKFHRFLGRITSFSTIDQIAQAIHGLKHQSHPELILELRIHPQVSLRASTSSLSPI